MSITREQLDASHRLGRRFLAGASVDAEVAHWTREPEDLLLGCLVTVGYAPRAWVLPLGKEGTVGRRQWREAGRRDVILVEGWQWRYEVEGEILTLRDLSTTNGAAIIRASSAAALEPTEHLGWDGRLSVESRELRDGDVVSSYAAFVVCLPAQ